ncbi:hypothetical protein DID88_010313 [Monilinia fructigena]|uniref:Uncharacterized protein n=1 Tax=Monilinia fructigena TaxID=38457 RepID=A0A395IMY3_9HELO|nr:hypothetical protein DID88_010313 [Monilinia fructigena]
MPEGADPEKSMPRGGKTKELPEGTRTELAPEDVIRRRGPMVTVAGRRHVRGNVETIMFLAAAAAAAAAADVGNDCKMVGWLNF